MVGFVIFILYIASKHIKLLNITRYITDHKNLDSNRLLKPWYWLIGEDKEIIVITKIGDVVMKDFSDKLYFLSITDGTIELISNYSNDFFKNRLSSEQYFEIFQPKLIESLEEEEVGQQLKEGQVYGYAILPVLGGKSVLKNIICIDIYEYFCSTASAHQKIDEKSHFI